MLLCQGNLFIPLHTILMTSSSISTYISMFFFFFILLPIVVRHLMFTPSVEVPQL